MGKTMMNATKKWFTEVCNEAGSQFGIQIEELLHHEQTPYQTIDIYSTTHFGNMMALDGFIMLTEKDNFIYHEMMAHSALANHSNPRDILIVGGGDCGTLHEVCKHPIDTVTQVEIDKRVTELSLQYFPSLCQSNEDKRASLIFADAIQWLQDAAPNSLDVIIIDSADPVGPGEGLFTKEFYMACKKALRSDGLLSHQSESPLFQQNLLKKMRGKMQDSGFNNLETIFFPLPTYPSGWWSATLASTKQALDAPRKLPQKISDTMLYYTHAIHQHAMSTPPFLINNKIISEMNAK